MRSDEPLWVDLDQVVELNQLIVEDTKEPFQILDPGLLESALYVPRNAYFYDGEDDVVTLAVMLLVALASNHPFIQGNKRTGFETAIIFLAQNGYSVDMPDVVFAAELIIDVLERKYPVVLLEDWFREFSAPRI